MTEIILGTAQFGHGYGITNDSQRIDDDGVIGTLRTAVDSGIHVFDTADGYGDAQARVGQFMPAGADVGFISKFTLEGVPTAFSLYGRALGRLGAGNLQGLLAHSTKDFLDERFPQALALIRKAKAEGLIGQLGASVYDEGELELAVKVMPDLDFIQIPASVVDRRLIDSALVGRLKANGVQVHVRSAFLQGLLLSPQENLPPRFSGLRPLIARLDSYGQSAGKSRLCLLLGFLKYHELVDAVVVGATSHLELEQIVRDWANAGSGRLPFDVSEFPPEIVDPRRWLT